MIKSSSRLGKAAPLTLASTNSLERRELESVPIDGADAECAGAWFICADSLFVIRRGL